MCFCFFVLVPHIYDDFVRTKFAEKGVPNSAMVFMCPPKGQNVSRFIGEKWLDSFGHGMTIEDALKFVEDLCVKKGYTVKLESEDITSLSFEANQVLSLLIDLKKSPNNEAFSKFNLIREHVDKA
jgi:hypothetical protein